MSPTTAQWYAAARPRTLPAAVVPVVVGTAAVAEQDLIWWRAVATLVVSLAIQVGTNFANDLSDGVRGTDASRVGPLRLVGSGLATPGQMKRAVFGAFGVAGVVGTAVSIAVGPELFVVGFVSVAAGWLYTGGPRPYGYAGLGEVFVFVFFGVVATVGSAYVQTGDIARLAVVASVPVGLMAVALMVTNNLRDIPGDTVAGKRTLAVRLGDRRTRAFYQACLVGAAATVVATAALYRWPAAIALVAAPLAVPPLRAVRAGASGPALIAVLGATGRVQLAGGLAFAAGLALGA